MFRRKEGASVQALERPREFADNTGLFSDRPSSKARYANAHAENGPTRAHARLKSSQRKEERVRCVNSEGPLAHTQAKRKIMHTDRPKYTWRGLAATLVCAKSGDPGRSLFAIEQGGKRRPPPASPNKTQYTEDFESMNPENDTKPPTLPHQTEEKTAKPRTKT